MPARLTGLAAVASLVALSREVNGALMGTISTYSENDECTGSADSVELTGLDQECTAFYSNSFRVNCTDNSRTIYLGTGCTGQIVDTLEGCKAESGTSTKASCRSVTPTDYVKFVGTTGTCAAPDTAIAVYYYAVGCSATSLTASQRVTANSTGVTYEAFSDSIDCSGTASSVAAGVFDVCVAMPNGLFGAFVDHQKVVTPAPAPVPAPNNSENVTAAPTSGSSTSSIAASAAMVALSAFAALAAF